MASHHYQQSTMFQSSWDDASGFRVSTSIMRSFIKCLIEEHYTAEVVSLALAADLPTTTNYARLQKITLPLRKLAHPIYSDSFFICKN